MTFRFGRAICILLLFSSAGVFGQLLPQQRVSDFQNLVAMYSKRYAPYAWKAEAFDVNMFNIDSWLNRVRAAKDDLEFYEIEAEYVAQLRDTHSALQMTSSFRADLGITVDIYDGKVLIDAINRAVLPSSKFPFQVGDELVRVDGVAVEDWITRIAKYRQWGNPVTTRRVAAAQIAQRSQSTFPRAHEIGDTAEVEIRRANGDVEKYTLPWAKTGLPVINVPPVKFSAAARAEEAEPGVLADPEQSLAALRNWRLPSNDLVLSAIPWGADPAGNPRGWVSGVGSKFPVFLPGLPSSFTVRRGFSPSDFHFSGTYLAGGATIGYLRIPSFAPSSTATAIDQIEKDLAYFEQNTQALIVDVMRNPGGNCFMMDVAARLIPFPFYFFGEQIRVTTDRLNSMKAWIDYSKATRAPQWVIDTFQVYLDALQGAYNQNGALTGPIPACTQYRSVFPPQSYGNQPAAVVYTKPLVILTDEFSTSAADIFPAMMQDNGRGVLVGTRTSGGGGSVSSWETGFYSESIATNTNTLVVRKNPIVTGDLPTAPYVENIGVRPDIELHYMTRENLMNFGRTFFSQVTNIVLQQIDKP
jgi:hypothetical protein